MPILRLAVASLLNRRVTVALTVFAVAVSVLLFVGVEKLRGGVEAGFERTISGTDLIVGARSSALNLLLYTVFRIGDPTNNITWQSYQEIAAQPDIAWTVPISLGDSHRGYRVVGTTPDYFAHYRYGGRRQLAFATGDVFADVFDAVLGAEVARALGYGLGDAIVLSHGIGRTSFAQHDDKPFRVVGILAPTGTPVDRSIHVSLAGIEAIHIGWQGGAPTPLARAMTAERVRALPLQPTEITAFLVGLESKVAVLRLQRAINSYRGEPLQAVIPGVALAQLWQVVGVAERALAAISAFVVVTGLVGILTSILTSVNERRREMAILRSVGARPLDIFLLLVLEAAMIACAGALLGLAILYALLGLTGPMIEQLYGVAIVGIAPNQFDLWAVLGVTGAAALLGTLPAWRAVNNALSDGLTLRL